MDFLAFSLALDESTDIVETAQLCIFIRGVDKSFKEHEEILLVSPMHGKTTGTDIFDTLINAIATKVPTLN
jgi:hypothetical protein